MLMEKMKLKCVDSLEEEIRRQTMDEIDLSYDVSDEEILRIIQEKIILKSKTTPLSLKERQHIENHVFNS